MCTREVNGKELEFGTTGYTMDSVFVLYDRSSESIWYPSEKDTMDAVAGPSQGESIRILDEPAPVTLEQWCAQYPDSLVLLPSDEDVAYRKRAYLGVGLEEEEGALRITGVAPGSPASVAGIQVDDLLLGLNEFEIHDRGTLRTSLAEFKVGDEATLIVERDGQTLELFIDFTQR